MKDTSILDLSIMDFSQIKIELGKDKTEYVLTSHLGKCLEVTYEEDILQMTFDQAELRLEIGTEQVLRLCKQFNHKSVKTNFR